jgi:hypothetical protein
MVSFGGSLFHRFVLPPKRLDLAGELVPPPLQPLAAIVGAVVPEENPHFAEKLRNFLEVEESEKSEGREEQQRGDPAGHESGERVEEREGDEPT